MFLKRKKTKDKSNPSDTIDMKHQIVERLKESPVEVSIILVDKLIEIRNDQGKLLAELGSRCLPTLAKSIKYVGGAIVVHSDFLTESELHSLNSMLDLGTEFTFPIISENRISSKFRL